MSVSARSLLVPGMALATAGVLALSPAVVAPSPASLAAPLAGMGRSALKVTLSGRRRQRA